MRNALILCGVVSVSTAGGAVVWLQAAAPQIDAVAVNPAYIVINTPTTVVFTAKITAPSLQPAGLNLLQTDSSGKTLSAVGVMNDTGTNGDAVAGDKVFSRSVSVSQTGVGQLYYRVSAPFKGVLARTLSAVIVVTVDPVKLPPHPGEAGKQTLAGIDSDKDGVRDDVERYVYTNYFTIPTTARALADVARAIQATLTLPSATPQSLSALRLQIRKANDCLEYVGGARTGADQFREIRAQMLDTDERSGAYTAVQSVLGVGGYLLTPEADLAKGCSF